MVKFSFLISVQKGGSMKNGKTNTWNLVLTALFCALTTVATTVIAIPVTGTQDYINIGDSMIFTGAYLLGPFAGAIIGAIGSALGDLILGYYYWIPFTVVIKGLEGLVFGFLVKFLIPKKRTLSYILTVVYSFLSGLIMVVGYFIANLILYRNIVTSSIVIPMNFIQLAISEGIFLILVFVFNIGKFIKNKNDKIKGSTLTNSDNKSVSVSDSKSESNINCDDMPLPPTRNFSETEKHKDSIKSGFNNPDN